MFKMRSHLVALAIILIFSIGMTSCAMIMSGTSDKVAVNSNVPNADIFINGRLIGKTPAIIKLSKSKEHEIVVKKDGYIPFVIQTDRSLNLWFLGDILLIPGLVGIVGLVLDFATGATYDIDPESFYATLSPDDRGDNSLLNNIQNNAHNEKDRNVVKVSPDKLNAVYATDSTGAVQQVLLINWVE